MIYSIKPLHLFQEVAVMVGAQLSHEKIFWQLAVEQPLYGNQGTPCCLTLLFS